MRNPLWRLKTLPWVPLLQNALLTVLLATLLDFGLLLILTILFSTGVQNIGLVIPTGIGFTLLLIAIAGGVGALSVILIERLFRHVLLDVATLWALVGCLILVLFVKTLTPIPSLFLGLSRFQITGLVLGLFAQSRSYWRR